MGGCLARKQNGSLNPNWKGGRHLRRDGYRMIRLAGHPRANSAGYVLEHILVAEKALGKPLPPGASVHHHNKNRSENHGNLVICQDEAYHNLIERRTKAYFACGNADWRKCCFCKEYDDPDNLQTAGNPYERTFHLTCAARYARRRYDKAKGIRHRHNWIKRNPKKYLADTLATNALRDGKLQRQPCQVCGNLKSDMHHDDYSKPFEVRWLCRPHHMAEHRKGENGEAITNHQI